MSVKQDTEELKRNDILGFLTLLVAAFIVSLIPVLHWPFSWMQTFFHEISHGLSAFFLGGTIKSIELNINGSGTCTSSGGIRFITAFSGYAGSILWGTAIYIMADNSSAKSADRIALLVTGLIIVTALLWAKDLTTILILIVMIIPFALIIKFKETKLEKYFIQFTGLYILLDAIKTPTYLLDGKKIGDSATLQSLTWIPEIIWIVIWVFFGIIMLIFLFMRHMQIENTK